MTQKSQEQPNPANVEEFQPILPSRRKGLKLFRRLFVYHSILAVIIVLLVMIFPGFVSQLPVGGVTDLVDAGDLSVAFENAVPIYSDDNHVYIVPSSDIDYCIHTARNSSCFASRFISQGYLLDAKLGCLSTNFSGVSIGPKCNDFKPVRVLPCDIQSLDTDRTG